MKSASEKLGLIDGIIVLPYAHLSIKYDEGNFKVSDEAIQSKTAHVPIESFTNELILSICKNKPQAMFGGTIKSYQKEVAPRFLIHLKEVLPDIYSRFIKEYDEYNKEIDHRGRMALLNTINPSTVKDISKNYPNLNSEWYWDGEYLNYKSGHVSNISVIKDYEVAEFKVVPSDKSKIKITDNDQVNENTIFID